jgi:hypothetical protein
MDTSKQELMNELWAQGKVAELLGSAMSAAAQAFEAHARELRSSAEE